MDHYIKQFRKGNNLERADAEALFDTFVNEQDESILVNLLQKWNAKDVTEDAIYNLVVVMRKRMKTIHCRHIDFVDVVGTGGSMTKTFNVSTAAAFVIAAAGVPVAKHGNRAVSSKAGSADVMKLLDINIDIDHATTKRCLNEFGMCFMFAPNYHRMSPILATARRSLGRATIFNILGPLCNPAGSPHQLIGVWDRGLIEQMGRVLARLGTTRSWIVHGENGLDEISLLGKTYVAEVAGGKVTEFEINAEDFGIDSTNGNLPSRLSAIQSAALIRQIFDNKCKEHDAEKLVLMNAAAAIRLAGLAPDLVAGYRLAKESIRSGAAKRKLSVLVEATNR